MGHRKLTLLSTFFRPRKQADLMFVCYRMVHTFISFEFFSGKRSTCIAFQDQLPSTGSGKEVNVRRILPLHLLPPGGPGKGKSWRSRSVECWVCENAPSPGLDEA